MVRNLDCRRPLVNPAAIRDARRGRSVCDITSDDILPVAPDCDPDLAWRLVEKFALA